MKPWKHRKAAVLALLAAVVFSLAGCTAPAQTQSAAGVASESAVSSDAASAASSQLKNASVPESASSESAALSAIPAYSGAPYVAVNDNVPDFSDSDLSSTEAFESYSPLDSLGRCGPAFACVGQETMPTDDRGDISSVTPTGWHSVEYDCVEGGYLYNRCHLIGYQLTAENANEENLITGTRYLNIEGMLPFENMVADHIKETGGHVLYRVTPVFEGDNLVASGVQMEAESVEDRGESILFNVYCYNVQPGVAIDYATGESTDSSGADVSSASPTGSEEEQTYILNTNTKKFHRPTCSQISRMKEKNKETYTGTREALLEEGYSPCSICDP